MPDSHAPAIKPLVEAKPGEPITAGRWNDMQCRLRSEHIQHGHTGAWKGDLYDGAPIGAAGLADAAVLTSRLADRAVTGDKVDPTTSLTVRELTATSTLRTAALELAETSTLALPVHDLRLGHSSRHGAPGRALVDLARVGGARDVLALNPDGEWRDGVAVGSDLQVAGKTALAGDLTTAAATVTGALTVKAGAAVAGPLAVAGGLTLSGALTATAGASLAGSVTAANGLGVTGAPLTASHGLSVAGPTSLADVTVGGTLKAAALSLLESPSLTVPCAELRLGHSSRRSRGPGRALVDARTPGRESLVLNYESDWSGGVDVHGALAVSGDASVAGGLGVAGNATVKGRSLVSADAACPTAARVVWGYVDEHGARKAGHGFTVETVDGPGVRIRFTTSFRELPCVIAQQTGNGRTTDNALVHSVGLGECIVYNGDASGDKRMRPFFFLALAASD